MRLTIAYEGVETSDGRLLRPDSLDLPDEVIPVLILPESDDVLVLGMSELYGRASDLRREDDGRITAVLDPAPPEWASPQIDVDLAEFAGDDPEVMAVVCARLRAVHLGNRPAWPALAARPRP